jgi:hypothetical protein
LSISTVGNLTISYMDYTILYSILLDPHVYQSSMYLYPILYIVIDKKVFFLPMEYIEKEVRLHGCGQEQSAKLLPNGQGKERLGGSYPQM